MKGAFGPGTPAAPGRLRLRPRAAIGAAAVALACLAAAAVELRRGDAGRPAVDAPPLPRADPLRRPAPPAAGPRPGQPVLAGRGWRVVSANSVSGVLLVIVETERLDALTAIAREVLRPATAELLEALVYFRRPGTSGAAGRVQWTPGGGYVPLRFPQRPRGPAAGRPAPG